MISMKILFVDPKSSNSIVEDFDLNRTLFRFLSKLIVFRKPLTFSVLAAVTPEKHDIEIKKGRPYDIDYDESYDLVGITTVTPYIYEAYKIADEFKRYGVKVVLGGWHASALPEEAIQHADSIIIGEAEETWPQLLKDMEQGKLMPYYIQNHPVDIEQIPQLGRNIFLKDTGIGIQATRGCPYGCQFCAITNMRFRNIFRKRPVKKVVDEIKSLPNKLFIFQDNSLTIDPIYTKQLFKAMKGINKHFLAYGNIDVLGKDDELLKLASEAGCFGWEIGLESVCQESLDDIGKKTNRVSEYLTSVKKIHDYGMKIGAPFIFGLDPDPPDIFYKTDEFVRKSEIDNPVVLRLVPYPGTSIYSRFVKENRILTKDWSRYNQRYVVFKPKNMTSDELMEKTAELDREWHTIARSTKRIFKSLNFGVYSFLETALLEIGWKIVKHL